jgi:hypothetical protein
MSVVAFQEVMMSFRALAVAVTTLAIASLPASAARLLGDGSISCEAWTEEREANSPRSSLMTVWVLGFMSAANVTLFATGNPDFLAETNVEIRAVVASIDEFCQAHPDKRIADAAGELVIELLRRSRN